jgi:progressive ankylosis protein
MMAAEGPFLAAVIARGAEPVFNLAAHGVAFAFAILVEAPVIMLMSTATALCDGAASYRRLRNFALVTCTAATLLFIPLLGLHRWVMEGLMGLPTEVSDLVHGALWLLIPWPAAIGYRRFLHGVLIRSGRTRQVALGTILRLIGMAGAAIVLLSVTDMPGAWVGALSLTVGVSTEAIATRVMASSVLRDLHESDTPTDAGPTYREVAHFYYPLALTAFLGLAIQPLLTFLMGRSPSPIESLAVFPVVHALTFLFRAFGFSYQEAVIALAARNPANVPALTRFGLNISIASAAALAVIVFTPLARVWFIDVSGLSSELTEVALNPARISVALVPLAVFTSYQYGLLVQARRTRPITLSTVLELGSLGALFGLFAWGLGWMGATAATAALAGARLLGNVYLARESKRLL